MGCLFVGIIMENDPTPPVAIHLSKSLMYNNKLNLGIAQQLQLWGDTRAANQSRIMANNFQHTSWFVHDLLGMPEPTNLVSDALFPTMM